MTVDFMMSHVGQMMSLVSGEPHQEKTGKRGILSALFRGQSPRFTTSSMSGRCIWDQGTVCREFDH